MKYILLLLTLIFSSTSLIADVVIPLQSRGGVFYLPCKVNGVSEQFIFDTGASNVCLSRNFINRLATAGAIHDSDRVGIGSSQVADGRTIPHDIYNIKELQIGTRTLKNVRAVVIEGQNAPLLLGQTAIRQLGKYNIDGTHLILKEASRPRNSSSKPTSVSDALSLYYEGNFRKCAEMLLPNWEGLNLSNAQKLILVDAANKATDIRGMDSREDILPILHDITLDDEIKNTFGTDKYHMISGIAYAGALRHYNAQESFRQAFESSENMLTKGQSLVKLANELAIDDMTYNAGKCFNIYWDTMDWVSICFEQETGTWLDYQEMMNACLTPSSKIFSYMSDELRDLAEETTFSILISGFVSGEYSSDEYNSMMDDLISTGNRRASKYKRGY